MFVETTGQCTCAVVKIPESLCQFVEDSATRVRLGRCSSCTCRSLFFFFKFVEACLPHQIGPWLVVHALVVVVSNGPSLGRAQEHIVNTPLGLGSSVLEKLWETVCCIPISSLHTCFPRNPVHTSATRKRSVDVGRNESTCSTTTQRSQQSDVVRSCMSWSPCSCRRRTDACRRTDDHVARGKFQIPECTS